MNQGYIKLYRKTLDSRAFQNEGLLKVWIWCLLKANHKGKWVSVKTGKGTTEVWIESGEFIFGKYTAAKELKMPPSTVWKRINKLIVLGNLVVKSNRQYSVITIVNWDTYQGGKEKSNHQGTTREPPSRPNKNDKNEKNNIYSEVKPHSTNSLPKIAKRVIDHLNQTGNRSFTYSKANLQIIEARLKEGHTEEDCKKAINVKWADPDFNKKYFRPSTLFRPTKFEGYLNEEPKEERCDKSWDI